MKHVEEDEHYNDDWKDNQDKFDEIQRKYNTLVRYLQEILIEQGHHEIKAEPKEFLIEYEE